MQSGRGRLSLFVFLCLLLLPLSVAAAPPPPLPEEAEPPADAPAEPAAPTDPAGEPGPVDPGLDAEPAAEGAVEGEASVDAGASLEPATDAETTGDLEGAAEGEGDAKAEGDAATDDDPGMVRGRREGMMPTNRGAIGLFHTTLPDVGDRLTFRFRIHTGFFRKDGFIYSGPQGPDRHARVLGGIALGFSPAKWGELFFSVNSSANRNQRVQEGRQDPEAIFALGDLDFGFKGAWRFKNGIGVGGQVGLGLLSGSERLLTKNVNFWVDGLFAVDVRYLTKKHFPFRFTTNIGWILDQSLKVVDYLAITDEVSAEVTRFSLGGNHNRLRMRYAIDFPVRFGKERQFGIDPILEWSWDVSTTAEPFFARENAQPSPLKRSSQWLTIGVRANVVSGLHIDAAADIGMVSPSFEYGPPQAPWQIILGLGWSFDPKPQIKEVPAESVPPPPAPAVTEGRIIGTVVDPEGNPVPDAKIAFPGLATGAIVTDAAGAFTSFRFPAGQVAMQIMIGSEVVKEETATVADGQDTQLTITLDNKPAAPTGVLRGTFTDASSGKPIPNVTMHVVGQGVDEPFSGTPEGLIALELYAGDYRATISAPGYAQKTVTFTVPEGKEFELKETMSLDKPPETPNVIGGKNSIRLKGRINYDGNQVAASSHAILEELATFLKFHPEYAKIRIGVHTDDRGAAKQRSDERAESVRSFLVEKGVEPDRIEGKGYGASNPVAVNLTGQGRAKNNRTVITVVSMK
jgi:outer membrane protein OmpA-like peptidoglycan-associated protein